MVQLTCAIAYGQPTKIYLSPKAALSTGQSTLFDSLKFYPLEVNKQTEIARYSYPNISDRFFYISHYSNKKLLIYSKAGKLIKEISYKKLGESAYPRYDKAKQQMIFLFTNRQYNLTEKDLIEIKNGFDKPRNKKYYKKYVIDLNDTMYSLKKAEVTAFDILGAYNLKNDFYCTYQIHVDKDYKDSLDYEVKIYQNEKLVKAYFPYNKQNEPRYLYAQGVGAVTFESGRPDTFYITRPYTDTVYALSNDVITPKYQIVLPMENGLPKSFFETRFKNQTERDNYERNNGWWLGQIHSLIESDRYMLMNIRFFSNYGQYVYDKKTASTYDLRKVKPDSTLYNLPSLMTGSYNRGENNRFYTLITSEDLKKVYELKNKSAPFPKELEACFKDPKNPTPVIVEYIIKN